MLFNPKWNRLRTAPIDSIGNQLLDGAAYMREHGWCQSEPRAADGRVCMLGSLLNPPTRDFSGAIERLENYLGMSVATWNDNYCKTEQEAIEALERAAFHR